MVFLNATLVWWPVVIHTSYFPAINASLLSVIMSLNDAFDISIGVFGRGLAKVKVLFAFKL
jgi:hypothetical protein